VIWVGIWALLLLVAAAVFTVIGRSLWHQGKLMFAEVGASSERLIAVSTRIEAAADGGPPRDPAIFENPAVLRREQVGTRRRRGRHLGAP
jgi:hypothetical protein